MDTSQLVVDATRFFREECPFERFISAGWNWRADSFEITFRAHGKDVLIYEFTSDQAELCPWRNWECMTVPSVLRDIESICEAP